MTTPGGLGPFTTSSNKKKSRGELQAKIYISQQKIECYQKNSPYKIILPGIISISFAVLIQALFLMRSSPYYEWFSNRLIDYFKNSDPVLSPLFNQIEEIKKLIQQNELTKSAAKVISFFERLEKMGVNVVRTCKEGNYHTDGYTVQGSKGSVVIDIYTIKYPLFNIIQACNGGIEGLTQKLISFAEDQNRYRSQFLFRGTNLLFFSSIGFANTLIGSLFPRTQKEKFTPYHLFSLSSKELELEEEKTTREEKRLFKRNSNFNRIFFEGVKIVGVIILVSTLFVDLPIPFIISALGSFILPFIKYLSTPWYSQHIANQTEQKIKQIAKDTKLKLSKYIAIEEFPGSTINESLLIFTAQKFHQQVDLYALSHCLWREGFICETEDLTLRIYLTGNIEVFTTNSFWDFYEKVASQLKELERIKKIFIESELNIYPGAPHPESNLSTLSLFIKNGEFKPEDTNDPNLKLVAVNDGYAEGHELTILGPLRQDGQNYLKKLAEKFKKPKEKFVSATSQTNTNLHSETTKSNEESKEEFEKSKQSPTIKIYPGFFSKPDKQCLLMTGTKKPPLTKIAKPSPQKVFWPEVNLTYDPKNPNKTPNLRPLRFNGRYGSIFVYFTGNMNYFGAGLAEKIKRHFGDPNEVAAHNKQGFVLEYNLLVLKLLGSDGDTRIWPYREVRNADNNVVYFYGDPTYNAHKVQQRGLIKKPITTTSTIASPPRIQR